MHQISGVMPPNLIHWGSASERGKGEIGRKGKMKEGWKGKGGAEEEGVYIGCLDEILDTPLHPYLCP